MRMSREDEEEQGEEEQKRRREFEEEQRRRDGRRSSRSQVWQVAPAAHHGFLHLTSQSELCPSPCDHSFTLKDILCR